MDISFLQKCGLLTSLEDFFDFVLHKDSWYSLKYFRLVELSVHFMSGISEPAICASLESVGIYVTWIAVGSGASNDIQGTVFLFTAWVAVQ